MNLNPKVRETCRRNGIDIEKILGDYVSHLGRGVFTSFVHIVRNLLQEIYSEVDEGDEEGIRESGTTLKRYVRLIQGYPEFRESHMRKVPMGNPLGMGDIRAYVDSEYQRLTGKTP